MQFNRIHSFLRPEALVENRESKQRNAVFLITSCHQQAVSKQAKTLFSKGTENLFLTSCVFSACLTIAGS